MKLAILLAFLLVFSFPRQANSFASEGKTQKVKVTYDSPGYYLTSVVYTKINRDQSKITASVARTSFKPEEEFCYFLLYNAEGLKLSGRNRLESLVVNWYDRTGKNHLILYRGNQLLRMRPQAESFANLWNEEVSGEEIGYLVYKDHILSRGSPSDQVKEKLRSVLEKISLQLEEAVKDGSRAISDFSSVQHLNHVAEMILSVEGQR